MPHEKRWAVGNRVCALLIGHLQRRRHALPRFDVPGAGRRRGLPEEPPQLELEQVGTRAITPGHEGRARGGGGGERGDGITPTAKSGRIALRSHEEKVVVHHESAAHEEAGVDERALELGRVHQHDLRITAPGHRNGLARAHGDNLDLVTAFCFEDGQEGVQ